MNSIIIIFIACILISSIIYICHIMRRKNSSRVLAHYEPVMEI